jgi:hypothetical protein
MLYPKQTKPNHTKLNRRGGAVGDSNGGSQGGSMRQSSPGGTSQCASLWVEEKRIVLTSLGDWQIFSTYVWEGNVKTEQEVLRQTKIN